MPIQRFIDKYQPSWVIAVEAVLRALSNANSLQQPWLSFTTLQPFPREPLITYAMRVRDAFYNLPREDQETNLLRQLCVSVVQRTLPQAWALFEPEEKRETPEFIINQLLTKALEATRVAKAVTILEFPDGHSPENPNLPSSSSP